MGGGGGGEGGGVGGGEALFESVSKFSLTTSAAVHVSCGRNGFICFSFPLLP